MSQQKNIRNRAKRRSLRVRSNLRKRSDLPRVSVFRSLNQIYAQIIDDSAQKTLVSCSSLELTKATGDKKSVAHAVGVALAERAKNKGINAAVFDRGRYLYHGRVKSLAEGLREGGLTI